jgi:octaprenyl-diphosphate synthase
MNLEEIYGPVGKELEKVEENLLEFSKSGNGFISKTVSKVLSAGGKRLRPALLLASAKTCDYSGERSIRLATALELIHTASLIHDDVIDNASLRRGISTVNFQSGNRISILVGDYLYSRVFTILAEDGDLEVMRSICAATNRMAQGEITQILSKKDINLTKEQYLSIIADKTASLISCCCRMGAIIGRTSNGEIDTLTDYGLNFGMAFQITDDLLDLTGKEELSGKLIGNDIREGKLTLPLIHTMSVAGRKDKKIIEDIFKSEVEIDDGTLRRNRT